MCLLKFSNSGDSGRLAAVGKMHDPASMKLPEVIPGDGAGRVSVAVLMATRNGAEFIGSQIETIRMQQWPEIDLFVSDDGSSDETLFEVNKQAETWSCGSITIMEGPQRGFSENFRNLIVNAPVDADYVAFSDQDDLWHHEKIARSVQWLGAQPSGMPAVFCGRTAVFSSDGTAHLSPLFARSPSFRNAMVQSIAGGNTMVLNRAAFDLLREASRRTGFISHDWWVYLLVTGAGGRVHYSRKPYTRYRQHEGNQVGANDSWRARAMRVKMLLKGRFKDWTDNNIESLSYCRDLLTTDSLAVLDGFSESRKAGLVGRIAGLQHFGLYRQTLRGQIGLYVASAINAI